MLTMAPPPERRIASMVHRVMCIAPSRSVSRGSIQSSMSGRSVSADALLTRTSTPPNADSANATSSRASSRLRTSARWYAALPWSRSIAATVSRPPPSSMSLTTTTAPVAAKRAAIARPQPLPPAPVTITTRLSGEAGMSAPVAPILTMLAAGDPAERNRPSILVRGLAGKRFDGETRVRDQSPRGVRIVAAPEHRRAQPVVLVSVGGVAAAQRRDEQPAGAQPPERAPEQLRVPIARDVDDRVEGGDRVEGDRREVDCCTVRRAELRMRDSIAGDGDAPRRDVDAGQVKVRGKHPSRLPARAAAEFEQRCAGGKAADQLPSETIALGLTRRGRPVRVSLGEDVVAVLNDRAGDLREQG